MSFQITVVFFQEFYALFWLYFNIFKGYLKTSKTKSVLGNTFYPD